MSPKIFIFQGNLLIVENKSKKSLMYFFSKLVQTVSTKQDFDICCLFFLIMELFVV